MGNRLEMIHDGSSRTCGNCAYGSDYHNHVWTNTPCTVKCTKHNCRVYALGGRCKDHEKKGTNHGK